VAEGRRRRDAYEAALGALGRRERSVAELTEWLDRRGYEPAEVGAAVGALLEQGGLDDERFARLFAEDKRTLSGWGPERIAAALRERGIAEDAIERACGGEDPGEQVERATELLARRGAAVGDERARSRALGYLTRRGYEYEVAYEAIRSLDRAA
jgi:regulatory protein